MEYLTKITVQKEFKNWPKQEFTIAFKGFSIQDSPGIFDGSPVESSLIGPGTLCLHIY